jgi:hypothetical protein
MWMPSKLKQHRCFHAQRHLRVALVFVPQPMQALADGHPQKRLQNRSLEAFDVSALSAKLSQKFCHGITAVDGMRRAQ